MNQVAITFPSFKWDWKKRGRHDDCNFFSATMMCCLPTNKKIQEYVSKAYEIMGVSAWGHHLDGRRRGLQEPLTRNVRMGYVRRKWYTWNKYKKQDYLADWRKCTVLVTMAHEKWGFLKFILIELLRSNAIWSGWAINWKSIKTDIQNQ